MWRKKWNLLIFILFNGNAFLNIFILYYLLMRRDVWFENHLVKKNEKLPLIWNQTCLDMWSIFGVKLNYIVIFERRNYVTTPPYWWSSLWSVAIWPWNMNGWWPQKDKHLLRDTCSRTWQLYWKHFVCLLTPLV